MDDRPKSDLSVDLKPKIQATETWNGRHIPVGTLDEFCQAVYGQKLTDDAGRLSGLPGQPILGLEKFKTAAGKCYRLIWIGLGKAWLAGEDTERYTKKILAMAGGEMLADRVGTTFSEATR